MTSIEHYARVAIALMILGAAAWALDHFVFDAIRRAVHIPS